MIDLELTVECTLKFHKAGGRVPVQDVFGEGAHTFQLRAFTAVDQEDQTSND